MITSTVSSKGQVTIPKKIREFLKVEKFDKIVFFKKRQKLFPDYVVEWSSR